MARKRRFSSVDEWEPSRKRTHYTYNWRWRHLIVLLLAIVALAACLVALIIVFSVGQSWFQDSFNQVAGAQPSYLNQYGLWRLCFFANKTCESWFSTTGPYSNYIDQRLNQNKIGINAWQALEIVFLFLIVATTIIAIVSLICFRLWRTVHYYSAILAAFCIWPAVSVGVSAVLIFFISVYNSATAPRQLDWAAFINLAAVVLSIIAAILLSIYDYLLEKPVKSVVQDDAVVAAFADFHGYPVGLSPSTFVLVRSNKKKRGKPYEYPRTLQPNYAVPTGVTNHAVTSASSDYVMNPNHRMIVPYTTMEQKNTIIDQHQTLAHHQPDVVQSRSTTTMSPHSTAFREYPAQSTWRQTETQVVNRPVGNNTDLVHDYLQRGIFPPQQMHLRQAPQTMQYHKTFDNFSTLDPANTTVTRHHVSTIGSGLPVRYSVNPPYYD